MIIFWIFLLMIKLLIKKNLYPLKELVIIALLLIWCTGCSQVPLPVQQLPNLLPGIHSKADFQMRVTHKGNEGKYEVVGNTNLPDDSRIAVAAIRYLRPDKQLSQDINPETTYSILDYKDTKVNKGKWEITLNLWKTAPDGQLTEDWQLEQSELGLELEPVPEVTFLATLSPTIQFWEVERQLNKQGIKVANSVIRSTADGERYVQTSQVLPIDLPTGKTTPPSQKPEDVNGGWGPRYLLIPEPPIIYKLEKPALRRTNEPLSPEEFL
ncbi:MAG: hypothetical protein F6J92_04145 [Symploca sp. SIO1A3]|nr:hypothetical protein [Symploca sp. SIO2C1]NER45875.1 hypothetical protein [Symploca sp. SIO1A3]